MRRHPSRHLAASPVSSISLAALALTLAACSSSTGNDGAHPSDSDASTGGSAGSSASAGGSSAGGTTPTTASGGTTGASGTPGTGTGGTTNPAAGGSGGKSNGGTGGTTGTTATGGTAGTAGSGSGGAPPMPPTECTAPVTAAAITTPSTVVGDGTAASCTPAVVSAAIVKGGVVTFNCGAANATITVTSEIALKKDTVIDGGGKITLSGGGKTRILHLASAWDVTTPKLTVQHLAFTGGFTTDVDNTKKTDQGGAAIFREGGSLDVIDCRFTDNHCAKTGQDVSGGAITSQGVGKTNITGSTFTGNSGSDGGAVGNLGNILSVANSTFDGNAATGKDGNPGNGGNGGAIVFDGAKTTMTICGSTFTKNTAGAQGGAIFRVAYTDEVTTIDRCTFDGNAADATAGLAGALYLENTTIQMTATTLSNNKAHYGGGLWAGQSAIANLTNVTVANNSSDQGGGFWFANDVHGTFLNCTISGNTSTYGGALFAVSNLVTVKNSILTNDDCKGTLFTDGGNNLAFKGGVGCVAGAASGDPLLATLGDNGGPTKTMAPGAGSPAIGKGKGCPAADQRGTARPADACTLGAYEAP